MLKPTPHPKATPINASQLPTLYYLEPFPMEKECPGPHRDGLGVISGSNSYRPPLPPYRVGNGLHFISGQCKVDIGWLVNAYSSPFIHPRGRYAHKA